MVRLALVALVALVANLGCVQADYQCAANYDCNVGEAGRCELDHRCTQFDPTCATLRRYSDHGGPTSNVCFDDHVTPQNLCAAGQPPAVADACTANVCAALPTCCETGWSEACVQQAQLQCSELRCDTRIAITATKAGKTELWDVRFDGAAWTGVLDRRQNVLAWLAPAPGTIEPQLAGFVSGALKLDDRSLPVSTKRNYLEATSVDFDRDGRATAVLGYTESSAAHLEVIKLDDGTTRDIPAAGVTRLSWGDVDHDPFPDGVAAAGGANRYQLISSSELETHERGIDDRVSSSMTGSTAVTPTPPPVRGFDWIDFDGDHLLDVVAYGFSVDVHLARGGAIGTTTLIRIDCDPPGSASIAGCNQDAQNAQDFAGAALPGPAPSLIIATHPKRALYRVQIGGSPVAATRFTYTFPVEACGADCPPIIAVVVRDLDGDHALDVIAIDSELHLYTALARDNLDLGTLALQPALTLPTVTAAFVAVRTSVTGAPRAN